MVVSAYAVLVQAEGGEFAFVKEDETANIMGQIKHILTKNMYLAEIIQ